MPNAKVLESKKAVVETLTGKIQEATSVVFVDYKGITVAQDTELRKQFREAGVEYSVVKNTMLKFAAQEVGFDGMIEHLNGTTAIAIASEDVVAPAKILAKFAKDHDNFSIKTGFLEGAVVPVSKIEELAKLPSKEVLIAQTLYSFNYPIMQLAIALNAIAEKGEADQEALVSTLVGKTEAAEEAAE